MTTRILLYKNCHRKRIFRKLSSIMVTFHWNPIRRYLGRERSHTEFSTMPIMFVPRNYIHEHKKLLYNNLFILLAGLWTLTISHDMDISDTETRAKLKNIFTSSSLCLSHLVLVPLLIGRLHLHYSIILSAMGMGVVPFIYYITNPTVLSVAICLRVAFVALFDVSTMIYIVKLARICSKIQGNAVFNEILTMRSLIAMFSCTAKIASVTWREYSQYPEIIVNDRPCDGDFYPHKSYKKIRLTSTLSTGQNTLFVAVAIIIALSGIILIAMYLKPITSLGDTDLSGEPRLSNPWRIFKQLKKPKAIYLALLITSCAFMNGMINEFMLVYVTCSYSNEYGFFISSMKQVSIMLGVMTCVTLVDFMGFRWLYIMALCSQLLSYIYLVFWKPNDEKTEISYLVLYHILCVSISIETSVLQLLVIQTISDDEVSAWCFYYVLGDIVHLLGFASDIYLCTSVKLWILIGISPITIMAIFAYWYRFDDNVTILTLYGPCSQLIKTSMTTLAKPFSFNLNILADQPGDIIKLETYLERKYTLKSRFLVPPLDDVIL